MWVGHLVEISWPFQCEVLASVGLWTVSMEDALPAVAAMPVGSRRIRLGDFVLVLGTLEGPGRAQPWRSRPLRDSAHLGRSGSSDVMAHLQDDAKVASRCR